MNQALTLYHIFNAVAETGNISRAAKELYISQPAISKAISKLEQSLDVPLFTRSSRGVTLTDSGKLLYEYTSAAFHQLEKGEESLKRNRQLGIGHIRIGVSTTLCKYMLLPYLKEFTGRYPHIRISIQCQSTFQTVALLQNRKVDIGFIGRPGIHSDMLAFDSIGEILDIFVCTPAYLANLFEREPQLSHAAQQAPGSPTLPATQQEPCRSVPSAEQIFPYANLMLLDEENISRRYIDSYFRSHEIATGPVLEVSTMDLLIEFARVGLGVACVIGEFVRGDLEKGRLLKLPLSTQAEPREVGFSYLKDRPLSDSLQKFIDFYSSI